MTVDATARPGPLPAGAAAPAVLPDPVEVRYHVHFTDLLTGTHLGRLPMTGVKHSIVLGGQAGALTGRINVADPRIRALDPWAVAVPRRSAVWLRRIERYPAGTLPDRETIDWGGIVWDLSPIAGQGKLELKAATPESYFVKRFIDVDRAYTATEQTEIHADLITYFQTYRPNADIRVAATPIDTGVYRDRTYLGRDLKQLAETAQQLGAVEDGFDWWIRPYRDPATGGFGWAVEYGYPRLGRRADGPEGPLRLRHLTGGGGNLVAAPTVLRQGTVVHNEAIGLGATEGDEQLRVVVPAADLGRDELARGFPLLQVVHSDTNVSEEATLRDNTAAALREGWASEVLLTKVTLQGTRRPTRADIGLGDDTVLTTDDATWPRPVTLTGRVWAIETTCATGDSSETVDLTLAGSGLTA